MLAKPALVFSSLLLTFAVALTACDSSNNASSEPPPVDEFADSDGDGLSNIVETEGWAITVYLANGETREVAVSSDPNDADTDDDGVPDGYEKSALTDPRNADTDDDQLTDLQELDEIYSSPYRQDSDNDGLFDGLEFNEHMTSPLFADSDGDQIPDGDEVILPTRNARVADLPSPTIEVGDIDLQLDVRFTETTSKETRELETRNVSSTLTQGQKQEYSNTNSNTQEAMAKFSVGTEYEVEGNIFGPGGKFTTNVGFEAGWTGTWTSSSTATSSAETQRAYQESLSTDVETTEGATVTRTVEGARMMATITLENASNLAYSIRNMQVTAFIQDPQDATRLRPVATLLPDSEPADGYHLGPLVPERGPFIFSSDLVFPNLVESLMKNPRGLVFVISNYDITDELGRNFAFSSQEVVERTAALVIDFGNYDSDGDSEGDLTEYHRVAASSGRQMPGADHRVVFDANGQHVGITLRDALDAIGLTHYDEDTVASSTLSPQERQASYATVFDTAGVERIFRIREAAIEPGVPKAWEILTATGIDQTIGVEDFILRTEDDIKLAFVQDVDQDRLVASLEFMHNCSDSLADTDGDGLDDRQEALLGWEVQTVRGNRQAFSRCSARDTDGDGLTDAQESGAGVDCDIDGIVDATWVTDPSATDTDDDGVTDLEEICGYNITLRASGETIAVKSDPTDYDTDDDTASDGVERRLGGNPTDPSDIDQFADTDGDGLVNYQETDGWDITVYGVSTAPAVCSSECDESTGTVMRVTSNPNVPDSDGDGLLDGVEKTLKINPAVADTDNDGLTDFEEVRGFAMRDAGIITLDPTDADTDNDKRSDGDEAELDDLIATRWIVRVVGQDPYRVYSDPRSADVDFDTVVDGDEFASGSDPHLANTDGDRRDDAGEIALGLNPLEADFKVTVFLREIEIIQEGEVNLCSIWIHGSQCGDAETSIRFDVRRPDEATPTGLEGTPARVVDDWDLAPYMPTCNVDIWGNLHTHLNTPCVVRNSNGTQTADGIQMRNGDVFELYHSQYGIPDTLRSITFSVTENQRFSVEGQVGEFDVSPTGYSWLYFGGLNGSPANQGGTETLAVFEGSDVISQTVEHYTFDFLHPDWSTVGPDIASQRVNPGEGRIRFSYIVE